MIKVRNINNKNKTQQLFEQSMDIAYIKYIHTFTYNII